MDVQIFIATDISKFEPPHLPQNKTKKKTTTKKSIASKTNNKYKISKNVNKIYKIFHNLQLHPFVAILTEVRNNQRYG
jgi:hypothetical protein